MAVPGTWRTPLKSPATIAALRLSQTVPSVDRDANLFDNRRLAPAWIAFSQGVTLDTNECHSPAVFLTFTDARASAPRRIQIIMVNGDILQPCWRAFMTKLVDGCDAESVGRFASDLRPF